MVCLAGLLALALFGPGDLSATVRILKAPQAPLFAPNLLDNLHLYFWALAVLFISIFMLTVENEAKTPINPIRVQEV